MKNEKFLLNSKAQEAEKYSELHLKKNRFILDILNKIGSNLNENFVQIKEFDIEINLVNFIELMDYFTSLCENKPEKEICLKLILIIILQKKELNENHQNLINEIMKIVLNEDFLNKKENRFNLLNKLIEDDLKKILNNEQNEFILNYSKLFGLNIMVLFQIVIYFFSNESNLEIFSFTLNEIKKNYSVIISKSILDLQNKKKY